MGKNESKLAQKIVVVLTRGKNESKSAQKKIIEQGGKMIQNLLTKSAELTGVLMTTGFASDLKDSP